jgi:glycosyltransferase involved in cell wall biosynthesis
MKILHLVTTLNPGGIERWILQMLEAIPRGDCAMDVCCQSFETGLWSDKARALGAKVMLVPFTPDHIVFGIRLARILRRFHYDILHIHVGAYSGFPSWIGHRMNVKVITTFHNVKFPAHLRFLMLPVLESLRSWYAEISINYSVKESDFLVGVSRDAINAFVPSVDKFRSKSLVINHGVSICDAKTIQSRDLFRKNLGWPTNSRLIVNVGRFNHQKNHHAVLHVFEKVCDILSDARLVLVGDGDLRSKIEQLAHELSLGDKVAFLGFRDDAAEILGFCDLMLMPSLYEGFGITAIEASAASIPVIGSCVPGLAEAVEDGRTGLLFALQDYSGMADAIVRFLSDPDSAKKMGEAGRKRVQEHFSIESMSGRYLALYRRCMESAELNKC